MDKFTTSKSINVQVHRFQVQMQLRISVHNINITVFPRIEAGPRIQAGGLT